MTQGTLARTISGKAAMIAALCALATLALFSATAEAAAPKIEAIWVTHVTSTSAVLKAKINPGGAATKYFFEYGTAPCPSSCVKTAKGETGSGSSSVEVEVPIEGLQASTVYHYRALASNPATAASANRLFATYGSTFEGLPDGRAYEQASPVDKDGGDAQGLEATVKATPNGDGISFGSDFGIPGGKGFGTLPAFLASRGTSNWSSTGILPPPSVGDRTAIIGWSPDYSRVYSRATKLQTPRLEALVEQSSKGGPITVIAPYAAAANDTFAGETEDGSVVFFEAKAKLPPKEGGTPIAEATEGLPNLYAWDRESGEVRLAGIFNQGEGAPKGSFAGPYDWSVGSNAFDLREGGGERNYYLGAMHAVTPEGNVYFTAAGTAQLYLRLNPTKDPSPVDSQGKCLDTALACTIHVSATQKDNGNGEGGIDPVGPQPAAFQAASKDGSQVFFTSSEKLTNDANTGPEQPLPAIGRAKPGVTAEGVDPKFLKEQHAVGVARHGPWLYWANPSVGAIGRVKLNAEEELEPGTLNPIFISPPPSEGKCEAEEKPNNIGNGIFKPIEQAIPSEPRYLAIEGDHVYWTNTGRRGETGDIPLDGGGTIGRATLSVDEETVESEEPAFICGEDKDQPGQRLVSDPQGIAVNESHIYWANDAQVESQWRSIARAAIDGSAVKGRFIQTEVSEAPYGVALDAGHLYYVTNDEANNFSLVRRANLEGKEGKFAGIGEAGLRGVALDAGHLYYATQGEGDEIGRCNLELEECNKTYIDLEGAPNGLAMGTAHLFWATNGENSRNTGNDLYRYEAQGDKLEDLTVLPRGPEIKPGEFENENGAEVQGVLGVSPDAKYIYFTANGVLAAGATRPPEKKEECKGPVKEPSGKCNLYVWHDGQVSFIARLDEGGLSIGSDAFNWVGSPFHVLSSSSYRQRTSFLGNGGKVLVFRSQERLGEYENTPHDAACGELGGKPRPCPEFYRYDAEEPGRLRCLTCRPSGEDTEGGPRVGSIEFSGLKLVGAAAAYPSRNLSAAGERFFFETAESLSPVDTNGQEECKLVNGTLACLDVYEWEAVGTPQCEEGSPGYSTLNEGCVYLISSGKSPFPSFFGDASEDGSSAFFFTRQGLVGQDKDELQDVYDARIGGGLPAQNPAPPNPCESAEACHGPASPAPVEGTPATPGFIGPGNVVEKRKPKPKKHKHKKKAHHKKKAKSKHRAEKLSQRSGR
jgi:hypothetical protein